MILDALHPVEEEWSLMNEHILPIEKELRNLRLPSNKKINDS